MLDAEETAKLVLKVENKGPGDGFELEAHLVPDKELKGLSFPRQVSLGTVPAGQSVAKEVVLTAGTDLPSGTLGLAIEFREANGFDPDPCKITFATRAFEPPRLILADMGIEDQSGNAQVEPREMVTVTARIQNIGRGDARGVFVEVETGPNVFLAHDSPSHFDLGALPSGQYQDVQFVFYTNTRIKAGEAIPISLKIGEERPSFHTSQPLRLVMNAPQRRIAELVIEPVEPKTGAAIVLAGGLSVDVDQDIPQGKRAGSYDVAVVIGNRNYAGSGCPDVDYADRDAKIMREYLIRAFGYDPKNIILVEDAKLSGFQEVFGSERDHRGRLFRLVKPKESAVFIYYVGHGAPDLETQEAYFVPVDANPQYLKATGYPLETFYRNLSQIPARRMIIVLDACFSGHSPKGMLFKGLSPALVRVRKEYASPPRAALLASGSAEQVSTWYPEKRHSLFTYYLLKGLRGEADSDRDRRITLREMKGYLKENIPYMAQRLHGIEQDPVISGPEEEVLLELGR